MYKSVVGIFVSNVFMIWLVLLNNEGPGWEVPVKTMGKISTAWIVIIIGLIFSLITLLASLKQLKIRTLSFKLVYFISLALSFSFFIFLISVEAYHGQYWRQSFPSSPFVIVSMGINILLLTVVSLLRFKIKTRII